MKLTRMFLTGLASLLLASSALAATVMERSVFAQGVWWNPERSGDGFEIFSTFDQVMVIWYTYDGAERPIWYTAQGELSTIGTHPWPLMKHRWVNGRKADAVQVGTLRMAVRNPEAADLAWEIGSKQGTWGIQPFTVSGATSEVDHSGMWFDPINSGWGFSLTEQNDVMGGLLFTYDANGDPTWAAGFDRTPGRVELFTFTGACTACTYHAPVARSVGRLSIDFHSETKLTVFNELNLAMAPGVNVGGARLVPISTPASWRPADRQLANFNAPALKTYLDMGMQNIRPTFAGGFSAAPPASAYSPTNLIESGVDEADLVKSDGRYVYTYAYANSVPQPAIRIAQLSNDGATIGLRGTVSLLSGSSTPMGVAGLYLDDDNLVSVTGTVPYSWGPVWASTDVWMKGVTNIEVLGTANPELPATRWRAEIDGHVLSSRRIGQRLYVVSRYVPSVPGLSLGAYSPEMIAANQQILAATPLAAMLPQVRIAGGNAVPLLGATEVFAPPPGSRSPLPNMIVVTAIDLAAPRIAQSLAVIGDAEAVYVSSTNLFVAHSRYETRSVSGALLPQQPQFTLTDVSQIRLGIESMSVVGSASVEGLLGTDLEKSAFRLSEHEGRLRVVTGTPTGIWGNGIANRLTILEPSTVAPGLLKTVSWLPNPKRPQSLGKPGEILYGTRYAGDRLYAVTFRIVDPLYVVDLADAADPKIAGALEVPGFSEYLHPLPGNLMLGFGKDATSDGLYQGLQLSLYDVSDAGKPFEIQRVLMGKRGSDSVLLRDHHAFSALPNADGSLSIAFPARIHDGAPWYNTGNMTTYQWSQSGLMRFEMRGAGPSDARLVQLSPLISHTYAAQGNSNFNDPAIVGGRSVLMRNGAIYVGYGQFWHQDSTGKATGPY